LNSKKRFILSHGLFLVALWMLTSNRASEKPSDKGGAFFAISLSVLAKACARADLVRRTPLASCPCLKRRALPSSIRHIKSVVYESIKTQRALD